MRNPVEVMRELQIASLLGARVVKLQLNGQIATEPDPSDFASRFRRCYGACPPA